MLDISYCVPLGLARSATIVTDNTSEGNISFNTAFQAATIDIPKDVAVADAGATGTFILPGAPFINIRPARSPNVINLPDGSQIRSTHTCELDNPDLPPEARQAHIVPGLAHTSLISIKMLCDAKCIVTYDDEACTVYYKNTTSEQQGRAPRKHQASNAYHMKTKQELIQFLHQCLFCPPKRTLLKAIKNNQLATTWPGLTTDAVTKYLPDSCPATDKGHMKRQAKGIRSTKTKINEALTMIEYERDINPPTATEKSNHLFIALGVIDPKEGTICADLTGNFPITALDGTRAVFIMYDWTTNAILATPIKDAKTETIVDSFKKNIEYLTKRGFKPVFNIIDNVATRAVKAYLETEDIQMQLVEPHNHRVNAAERAIQTFKNHTIAGLSIVDEDFPSILWSQLLQQSQDTLNMLRTSRVHPKLSAFHVLEGHHDFNRVPMAPPGTRSTIFNPPESRTSWGPRALDAWYIGPACDHYRCLTFFVPSTGGERTSGQYKVYPKHVAVPRQTPMDREVVIANKLTSTLRELQIAPDPHMGRHGVALQRLATIFDHATKELEKRHKTHTPTLSTPTAPQQLREEAPRVHQRCTRNNQPGQLPSLSPISGGEHERQTSEGERQNSEGEKEPPSTNQSERSQRATRRQAIRKKDAPTANDPMAPMLYTVPTPKRSNINTNVITHLAFQAIALATIGGAPITHFPFTHCNQRSETKPDEEYHHSTGLEHFCVPVIHPTLGDIITSYKKLAKDPELREVWQTAFGKEWGGLAQGDDRQNQIQRHRHLQHTTTGPS
eukprot:scaffold226719_cov36-Attheya_sp.AAC.1